MARRFPQVGFGPWQARRALRAVLSPGERLVGWCPAQVPTTLSRAFLHAALATVPGAPSAIPGDRGLRLLVVTDRQVVLLARGKGRAVSACWAAPLGSLRAHLAGHDRFDLECGEPGGSVTVTLPAAGRGAAGRAREALALLSLGQDPGKSPGDPPPGRGAEFARSSYGPLPAAGAGGRR